MANTLCLLMYVFKKGINFWRVLEHLSFDQRS